MKEFKKILLIVMIAIVTVLTFTSCEADDLFTDDQNTFDARLVGTWANNVDATVMKLRRDQFYSLTYTDELGDSLVVREGDWFNSGDILFVQYVLINGQSDASNDFYTIESNILTFNGIRWHKL
tara:strand:+ start:4367 stop:4738 length:372 start_codon:yes stop_codon:yes gene_type:complete